MSKNTWIFRACSVVTFFIYLPLIIAVYCDKQNHNSTTTIYLLILGLVATWIYGIIKFYKR